MRLGDVIRSYRIHRERTLVEVAREIGISVCTLQRVEVGKKTTADTVASILRWLTTGDKTTKRKSSRLAH